MSHYEGSQNNLRNPYRQQSIPMDEDVPIKPEIEMQWLKDEVAELKKELAEQKRASTPRKRKAPAKRPPTARQTTVRATKKQTARAGTRPVKKLPPMRTPGEQPRDSIGRFASKTGAVLKGAIFGTAHVVGGTVAAAQHGYKTVKGAHKRRKKAAGHGMTVLAGKPKRRRRKRVVKAKPVKQGFLSKLFGRKK